MNLLICFLIGVALCYLVLSYKAGLESSALTTIIKNLETRIIVMEKCKVVVDDKIKKQNDFFDTRVCDIDNLNKICDELSKKSIHLKNFCDELKNDQIDLKEKLSQKKQVIRISQPLQVEVVEKRRGVTSLIQKAGIKK